MQTLSPMVTIIVPIYNEAEILMASMTALLNELNGRSPTIQYELMLCENGSTDNTPIIASELAKNNPKIRVERLPVASYGMALKHGIRSARYGKIVVYNADFWDVDFLYKSIGLLDKCDLVTGSKNLEGSSDRRPFHRRAITLSFNFLLRMLFGFRGTDTHGIKAMKTSSANKIVDQCVTDAEIFDTELVLRTQRAGMSIREIPIAVEERRPSRYGLLKRVPKTFMDLVSLIRILGLKRKS